MKNLLICIAVAVLYVGSIDNDRYSINQALAADTENSGQLLAEAYKTHRSDFQIQGKASVLKLLPDDNNGSRHQRFIVGFDSGQTLLIAHNIDLAERLDNLKKGDSVEFYGEYEWNKKGGLIHWTHRDPNGRHVPGWIKHAGRTYQ